MAQDSRTIRRVVARVLAPTLLLGLVAGGALFAWPQKRAALAPTPRASIDTAPVASAPAAAARGRRTVGDLREYEVTLETDLGLVLGNMFGGSTANAPLQHAGTQRIRGHLVDLAVDSLGTGVIAMPDARVTMNDEPRPAIEDALRQGVLVEKDDRGHVLRLRLPRNVLNEGASALRTLTEILQWTVPVAGEPQWGGQEPTQEGPGDAEYSRADGPTGATTSFRKRVQRAPTPSASPGAGPGLLGEVAADEHGAFQTDALALESLSGQLVITKWSGDGHAMVARATTTLGVTGLGERVDVPAALRVSATRDDVFGPSLRLDETPALPVDSRAVLAEMVGTRTEGDLLREIADAAHDEDAARDLKRTLGAFLTLHPEECDAVARAIAQSTPADAGARMALTALARAGHLEAQRAMVSVAKAWGARGQAGAVLSLLGSFAEPSAETEAYLRARRDDPAPDVAIHAEEALADIAAHLRERDPARADAIAADIEARVARSAGQPAALAQELLVLGNTRSERAEEVALQYVGSSQASVRRMAVYAIGRALDDEGRALLSKIAQEDPDAQVRDEALRALATST